MKQIAILIFCAFVLLSCAKVETSSIENTNANSSKIVSVSPTIDTNTTLKSVTIKVETDVPLKPVIPKVKLNSEQKRNLNDSLPPKVREVLEKAEKFEILAEVLAEGDPDSMGFYPNRIAAVTNENDKREILESFYYDASARLTPSACYIPHHKLRAIYQGKMVEIEICFQCHLFFVEGSLGKFNGGLVHENQKSEDVLNRIIQKQSVEIK